MTPSAHYHLSRHEGAEKLVVFVTAARAKDARLDKFDFWVVGNSLNAHRLFLNNGPRNEWYQGGVPGLGDDVDSVVSSIETLSEDLGAKEIVFVGVSMGAYGALLYALKSQSRALAFGPETRIGLPGSRSIRMMYPGTEKHYPDLEDLIKGAKAPVTIYSAQRDPIDLYCMSLIKGLPNCELNAVKNVGSGLVLVS